jgi:hypothetical protein
MFKYLALAGALLCAFVSSCVTAPALAKGRSVVCIETGTIMIPQCNGQDFLAGVKSIKVEMHRVRGKRVSSADDVIAHPPGCPRRVFCGCGAAVRVFGRPIRDLWLAANWFKFPRMAPAVGMVAVRRHHVFVLEAHLNGNTWEVFDANSGHHATRVHPRSIAGYAIVNPHGANHFTSSGISFSLMQSRNSFATGSGTGYSPSA